MGVSAVRRRTGRVGTLRAACLAMLAATGASAQETYIGTINLYGFGFCPRDTLEAAGQLLPIAENTALFSLYGTFYGGDGRTTFALPDLRGRVPIGQGHGPGLTAHAQGARGGAETVTLDMSQIPAHGHDVRVTVNGTTAQGSAPTPAGNFPALSPAAAVYAPNPSGQAAVPMADGVATVQQDDAGGGQPAPTMPPFLALRFCVTTQGIYPSRN